MDPNTDLDALCEILGQALRENKIPRAERRRMRALLQRSYILLNNAEASPEAIHKSTDKLNKELQGFGLVAAPEKSLGDVLLERMAMMEPVKMRSAVRAPLLDKHHHTWSRLGDRLERITDWFWERCEPKDESSASKSIEDKAADEFGAEDMEYVWGRRRQ